jgi:hypothetical protein
MHRQTLVELYRGRESFSEGGANPVGRSIIEDGEVGEAISGGGGRGGVRPAQKKKIRGVRSTRGVNSIQRKKHNVDPHYCMLDKGLLYHSGWS